jgi:DNA invertase Pin-like site-specific DNA recombinase
MQKIIASSAENHVRVALYARVSTINNQDPEMQLSELREYAQRRGFQIVEEFTDRGVSGSRESRPALDRLMADACRRRFDAVLVWKIDRFGRSLKHLVNSLEELGALGVSFVSLRDNLDLSTPSGRLMFQIIGAMAEFERALIQERIRAGLLMHGQKGGGLDDRGWLWMLQGLLLFALRDSRGRRSKRRRAPAKELRNEPLPANSELLARETSPMGPDRGGASSGYRDKRLRCRAAGMKNKRPSEVSGPPGFMPR